MSINELLTMCVQEEGRLNQERIESAHLATQEKKPGKKGKGKQKRPLEKKGNLISLVCYESNMVHISYNTWWIDYGTKPCCQYHAVLLKPKETNGK